jgi:hypothetical protein
MAPQTMGTVSCACHLKFMKSVPKDRYIFNLPYVCGLSFIAAVKKFSIQLCLVLIVQLRTCVLSLLFNGCTRNVEFCIDIEI